MSRIFEEDGNYVKGSGRVLFKRAGDDHFRYIASTPELNINVTTETAEKWSSDEPVRQKLSETETQRDFALTFMTDDIDQENLAYFFAGEVETISQDSGAVTEEAHTAVVGGVFQLGVDDDHPQGKRGLSSVVIDDGNATAYEEGTDYKVDNRRGLLYILSGGALADGDPIEAAYSHGETSFKRVASTGRESIRGEMKFISNNAAGDDTDLFMPDVLLRAEGDFAMKSADDYQQLGFAGSCSQDASGHAVYTEGELT